MTLKSILATEDLDGLYASYASEEQTVKETLLDFEDKYPDVLKEDNLNDIRNDLLARQEEDNEKQRMKMRF